MAVFVVPRVDIGRNRRYGTYGCIKVAFMVHLIEGTLLLLFQREGGLGRGRGEGMQAVAR